MVRFSCSKCRQEKEFIGRSYCRPCWNEHMREYTRKRREADPEYRQRLIDAQTTHQSKEKKDARRKVCDAVQTGKLVRPEQCQACGGSGPIEAHHADYSKPLEVEWLCRTCHGRKHRV